MNTAISLTAGEHYLAEHLAIVERILRLYLPAENSEPKSLHHAMRYSVLSGGKRLRPILAMCSYEFCGGEVFSDNDPICKAMAALELVHSFSLIHDDLPCMDDDDLRRGQPSCHKKFGEAIAVLAGDALHNLAFGLVAATGSAPVVEELAAALGTSGMLGGQIEDVEAEGQPVDREKIISIHRKKTGALICASVRIGAILADAEAKLQANLTLFGNKVGLAFQIVDDILDIEGDFQLLGKNIGSDSRKNKATYPRAVGLEQSRQDARQLIDEAVAALGDKSDHPLAGIATYIGRREK